MLKSYGRWAPVLKVVHVQIRKLQLEENWLAAHWFDALQNLERLEETQEMTLEEYVETGLNMKWEAALGLESPVHFTTTKTIKPITVKMVSIGKGDHQSEEKEEEGDGKDEKATDESEEPDEKMEVDDK